MDISSWIADSAKSSPNRLAIRYGTQKITYADLKEKISHLAGALTVELAIGKGDRVAFLGRNSPELLQLLFACARIGAIFVPLNNRMTVGQLKVFSNHFGPRCMFAETRFGATAAKILEGMRGVPLVIFAPAPARNRGERTLPRLFLGVRPRPQSSMPPKNCPLLMIYTSGTTGVPKGALLTHDTLFYGAMNSVRAYKMTRWDEILTFIPMSHVGGLAIQTLPALQAGATVTIHVDFDPAHVDYDPAHVLREIERSKISLFVARPMASKAITSHPNWHGTDISSLRAVNSGSTHVPLHVMHPWFLRGVPVQQNYGMTEVLPPAIIVPLEDASRKIGSVGEPALHCQARIVDRGMHDVPAGERGQILLKGASVFERYWNNRQATEDAFHDGWFLTGDIGHVDKDGYYYIDGRIKDVIIVGSSNVYPADVERILIECAAIEEAAVTGQPDPKSGEAVVACVVLKKGCDMSADELKSLFKGRLASYQHPRFVKFMDAIPYTLSGKVRKAELRQMLTP